jgi:hypothetical protein
MRQIAEKALIYCRCEKDSAFAIFSWKGKLTSVVFLAVFALEDALHERLQKALR